MIVTGLVQWLKVRVANNTSTPPLTVDSLNPKVGYSKIGTEDDFVSRSILNAKEASKTTSFAVILGSICLMIK